MGKRGNRNYDKENSQLDRLKKENETLKRKISALRKQIDRLNLDGDRYTALRELINQQTEEEAKNSSRKDWTCFSCGRGRLKIVILPIKGSPKYFRKCNGCSYRTKGKNYTKDVEDS